MKLLTDHRSIGLGLEHERDVKLFDGGKILFKDVHINEIVKIISEEPTGFTQKDDRRVV